MGATSINEEAVMAHEVRLIVAAAIAACAIVQAGLAQPATTIVDFEQLSGPSFFCGSPNSPLTIGDVTLTGGHVMTAVSLLPANQTTVYGTASFCPGPASTLTITFARPASQVSLDVYNGVPVAVDYTVASNVGGTQTQTLPPNFDSGQARFTLADRGITSVTITGGIEGFWDFFIDNIEYTVMPTSKDECKNGGWREFGVFKNQGDCVAYIATAGRNGPSARGL
jgi:hypothetical protein